MAPRAAALIEAAAAAKEAEREAARVKKAERKAARSSARGKRQARRVRPLRWLIRWAARGALAAGAALLLLLVFFRFVNPPFTPYMLAESARLGGLDRTWVPIERIAPAAARAVVAAEDANFCLHWGFDLAAIEAAMQAGANRGASTIDQQVVKNVFLWQGRSWVRKALEAGITPLMELVWTKRRILEVYLNVAEFGTGIFGIEAAAQHYFGRPASELTNAQAAALAVILPSPKTRDPRALSAALGRHARQVASGAETIAADGRAGCFQP